MQGFDSTFKDFPDYILGITKEIWEDRKIATLNHYYTTDVIVRSPESVVTGNQKVIAATMATLSAFPDRRLLGEDVIWSGSEQEGMLSSHRILSTATHSGDGVFGSATNTQLRYRVLADCYAINNQISDEWLIRDQSAIVRQLGWQPIEYARNLIEREKDTEKYVTPLTKENNLVGPYQGKGNDNPVGQELKDILERIISADFSVIPTSYDRAANLFYPGGVEAISYDGADSFWMGLRASFPSATFTVDHVIGMHENNMPPRAAVRWSLSGKHDGWGSFGKPSNADVYVLGITHAEFGPRGLRREYTLIDEPAIYKQILLQQG